MLGIFNEVERLLVAETEWDQVPTLDVDAALEMEPGSDGPVKIRPVPRGAPGLRWQRRRGRGKARPENTRVCIKAAAVQ